MDQSLIDVIQKDYKERLKRILLFNPLEELSRKSRSDLNDQPVDMRSLGLFTLLYLFEMKLIRETKTGIQEIVGFLEEMIGSTYTLNEKQLEDIARTILNTFRPGSGKKKSHPIYNWGLKQQDNIEFSYIKASEYDVSENRQYYTLDDDGLELVFATKEYFQEFQLSIHQLMLRKLLEKGEFTGALRQINEMRMDVETIQDRMVKLEYEIKRNVVSIETQNRFMQVIEDRNFRLKRENEEFEALYEFVTETKENYYYQTEKNKEEKAYELLLKVEKALNSVHSQHRALLNQSFLLKKQVLQSAEESLYYVGVETFNFDQDITSHLISTPLPIDAMKGIIAPFLPLEQHETWSLLSIFTPHSWSEVDQSTNSATFTKIAEEEEKEKYAKVIRLYYKGIMESMLAHFDNRTYWTLEEWIRHLQKIGSPYINNRPFYDFFILCHQKSPLSASIEKEESSLHLLADVLDILASRKLTFKELPTKIQVTDRFEVQNMEIYSEGKGGVNSEI